MMEAEVEGGENAALVVQGNNTPKVAESVTIVKGSLLERQGLEWTQPVM